MSPLASGSTDGKEIDAENEISSALRGAVQSRRTESELSRNGIDLVDIWIRPKQLSHDIPVGVFDESPN